MNEHTVQRNRAKHAEYQREILRRLVHLSTPTVIHDASFCSTRWGAVGVKALLRPKESLTQVLATCNQLVDLKLIVAHRRDRDPARAQFALM